MCCARRRASFWIEKRMSLLWSNPRQFHINGRSDRAFSPDGALILGHWPNATTRGCDLDSDLSASLCWLCASRDISRLNMPIQEPANQAWMPGWSFCELCPRERAIEAIASKLSISYCSCAYPRVTAVYQSALINGRVRLAAQPNVTWSPCRMLQDRARAAHVTGLKECGHRRMKYRYGRAMKMHAYGRWGKLSRKSWLYMALIATEIERLRCTKIRTREGFESRTAEDQKPLQR